MATKKISPKLAEVLSAERSPRAVLRSTRFTPTQIASLKEVVRGRLVPTEPLTMTRAITALADNDDSLETATILGELVADESADLADRTAAAIGLRVQPGPASEKRLIENLRVDDNSVRSRVIQSLGTFGGPAALAELAQLPKPDDPFVAQQVDFAMALIAHRFDLPGTHLRYERGMVRKKGKPEEMIALSLRVIRKKTAEKQRSRLRGSDYGIELAERAFALSAGEANWTVFLNKGLGEEADLTSMFDRKWITAILAREEHNTKLLNPQYIVLTTPRDDSADIRVVRTDGELMYTGRAERKGGLLNFAMRDVARSGTAPTNVKGKLTKRGIEMDVNISFGTRIGAKQPAKVAGTVQ